MIKIWLFLINHPSNPPIPLDIHVPIDIRGTPTTGDQGADLIDKKNGRTIVIQAKCYENMIGNKAVQEVAAAVRFYNGDEGWVITNSQFTKSAKELAQTTGFD